MEHTLNTSPAHTPGPWEVHNDATFNNPYRIVATNGELVANFTVKADLAKAEANARLIAASPKLYEACHRSLGFIRSWEKDQGITTPTDTRLILEAAIAQVEDTPAP